MPVIDLGKVVGDPGASMRFRGEWNSGSEYFNNSSYVDTVTHHGSLWVCKQTNTGQEPIEGDYWGIGAQGNSDLNASDVTYDNESSGLSSNTAQGAIDEIVEIEKVVNGNQADLYSPDETYTAGCLVINNNALWKAKQDIDVAEAWTPEHWEPTTLAAELKAQAEDISDLNSRTFPDPASGTAIGEVDSYTAPSDGWLSLRLSGYNTNAQGIIECVDDNRIVGQSVYGHTGEWGVVTAMLPVKKGKTYHYVITSGTFQGFYFFGNHEPAI